MLLTIGMIVKNEEKYLERCLNGIKPILDNVDSELIITDTGSTDRTVEIAKRFTDKILHFEWADDFAAARNTALDIAKGEWFMFLDADEIFGQCSGIIDFFNSGEYKKYNAACYVVRNLLDDGKAHSDFMASRMTKVFKDTRFSGRVHEYLLHFTYPIKNISDTALHYGYMFEDKEKSKQKASRNIELMQKMLKEDQNCNPLIYLHLYDAYRMTGEIEEAKKNLDNGIDHCKENHSPYIAVYLNSKALCAIYEDRFDDALAICRSYFELTEKIRKGSHLTTDIEIYGIMASILYDQLNFSEAQKAYSHFFDIYEDVKNGVINTDDASALNFRYATDANYIVNLYSFVDCCVICCDFRTALKYIVSLPIYKYNGSMEQIETIIDKIMIVLEKSKYMKTYECYLHLNEYGKSTLIARLLYALYNKDEKSELISQLKKIGNENEWLKFKADIYESYFIKDDLSYDMIADYTKRFGAYNDPDLLKIAMEKNMDISCIFNSDDFDSKHYAYLCCKNIAGFYEAAENYRCQNIFDISVLPDIVKFYDYCISMRLMDNEDMSEEEKTKLISKLFAVKTAINEQYKCKNSTRTEFELLAASVKKNIRAFIYAGNYEDAKKTLEDYRKINPADPDIPGLLMMIK